MLKNLSGIQRCSLGFGALLMALCTSILIICLNLPEVAGASPLDTALYQVLPVPPGGTLVALVAATLTALLRSSRELLRLKIEFAVTSARSEQFETALRESAERYALLGHASHDGLWDWYLHANTIYFSPRWKALLGYQENEIEDSLDWWFRRVHPDDHGKLREEIAAHLDGATEIFQCEYRMLHRDGTYHQMLSRGLALRSDKGQPLRMAGSQTDVTERRAVEEQLLHNVLHDPLTGLPNRAMFMDQLAHMVERAKRHEDYLFAVLFLDLDGFKKINDSFGHVTGDQLLIAIGRKLKVCLRAVDTVSRLDLVARLAGDEFTILLDDIDHISDATVVADRIQRELAKPLTLNGHAACVSCSIGIALSSSSYEKAEDILIHADEAMYQAKRLGKARHVIFDLNAQAPIANRLSPGHALGHALSSDREQSQRSSLVA